MARVRITKIPKYQTGGTVPSNDMPDYGQKRVQEAQQYFLPQEYYEDYGPEMKAADPLSDTPVAKEYSERKKREEAHKKFVREKFLPAVDVATDVGQLGNFSPEPIGQGIGKVSNVVGGIVDAYQAADALAQGNYGEAAINAASAILPKYLDSHTFRRNSKRLRPGDLLYPLADKKKRTYYLHLDKRVKKQSEKQFLANRGLFGALGAETAYDASQFGESPNTPGVSYNGVPPAPYQPPGYVLPEVVVKGKRKKKQNGGYIPEAQKGSTINISDREEYNRRAQAFNDSLRLHAAPQVRPIYTPQQASSAQKNFQVEKVPGLSVTNQGDNLFKYTLQNDLHPDWPLPKRPKLKPLTQLEQTGTTKGKTPVPTKRAVPSLDIKLRREGGVPVYPKGQGNLPLLGHSYGDGTFVPSNEKGIEQWTDNPDVMRDILGGMPYNPVNYKNGGIVDPRGQWAHPGEITTIPSNDITMEGVPYPVLGIDDIGHQQVMYPNQHYSFPGNNVTEYPLAQNGKFIQPLDPRQFIQSSVDNTGRASQWYNNPITGATVPSSLTSVAAQDRNLAAQQKASQNKTVARQMRVKTQITESEEEAQERARVGGIDRDRNWVDQLATGMLHPNSAVENYVNYGYFPDENDPYRVSLPNMVSGLLNPMQYSEAIRHSAMNLPEDFGTMVNTGDPSSFALDAAMLLPIAKGAAPALRGMAGTVTRAAEPLLQSGARRLEGTLGKVATQADLADFSQYARNKYFPKPLPTNSPQIQAEIDASRNAGGLYYKELMNKPYPTEQDMSRFMKLAEPLSEEQFTGVFNRSRAEVLKSAEMRRAAVDRGLITPGGSGTSTGYTSGSYSPTEPIVDRVGRSMSLTDRILQGRAGNAPAATPSRATTLQEARNRALGQQTAADAALDDMYGQTASRLTAEERAAADARDMTAMNQQYDDAVSGWGPEDEAAYEAHIRQQPLPGEQGLPPAPPPDPNALFPEALEAEDRLRQQALRHVFPEHYSLDLTVSPSTYNQMTTSELERYTRAQQEFFDQFGNTPAPSLLRKYINKINPPIPETVMPLQARSLSGSMGSTDSRRESLKKFRDSYKTVKESPKGSIFKPTGESMSEDSYPFTLGLVERGVNEGIADVGYHGMQTLNGLGFPAKAGIPTQNILNDINQTIQKINAVSKTKLPFAKDGQVPLYSIQRKKNGGNIRPEIEQYANGGILQQGQEITLSPEEYDYLINMGYELE